MIGFHTFETAWGWFAYVASDDPDSAGLVATELPHPDRRRAERRICSRFPNAVPDVVRLPSFESDARAYFDGGVTTFDVPVVYPNGTPFRTRVYRACAAIPYGATATYADLARLANRPRAYRAVGTTMAANRLPLVIPCHRIVRSDGTAGGFSSPEGVSFKKRMLALEAANAESRCLLPVGADQ